MKVITFSKVFPKSHPSSGKPTSFVEKILTNRKVHTIRAGKRWKVGDIFSARTWTGKPYKSKQESFLEPVEIKKVWDIDIYETMEVFINGKFYCNYGSELIVGLASNDGLDEMDFKCWFMDLPFSGQIICWKENINY